MNLEPRLLDFDLARLGSLGNLLESSLRSATRWARVAIRELRPCLGSLGEDVSTILYQEQVSQPSIHIDAALFGSSTYRTQVISRAAIVLGSSKEEQLRRAARCSQRSRLRTDGESRGQLREGQQEGYETDGLHAGCEVGGASLSPPSWSTTGGRLRLVAGTRHTTLWSTVIAARTLSVARNTLPPPREAPPCRP